MRRIALKILDSEDVNGQPTKLNYAENLIGMARYASSGIGVDEMELALSIARAVKAAAERGAPYVVLEEPQHAYMVQRIRTGRYSLITEALLQFLGDVLDAESFDPNAESRDPGRLVPRVGPVTEYSPAAADS